MVYHIESGDKIMVDFISRATMGNPGMIGCRHIVHTYEFKWGYDFKDRVCFESYELPFVKDELDKQNIQYEVVTEDVNNCHKKEISHGYFQKHQ